MDLLLIQDLQPLFRVICLKYLISIADQIDLYKVRDLFFILTEGAKGFIPLVNS